MNDLNAVDIILEAANKYLDGQPPNWKLFRGRKSYTATQALESLKKDPKFREWFVKNVLNLTTELLLRGRH